MRNELGRARLPKPGNRGKRGSAWKARGAPGRAPALTGILVTMLAVGGGVLAPTPSAAQDRPERPRGDVTCRCVDAEGNAIEECACFRRPRLDAPSVVGFLGQRARLGVRIDVSRDEDAGVTGARVMDVLEDGPAAEAGIREGDIITHIDGRSLSEPVGADRERDFDLDASVPAQRLLALIRDVEPGEAVEVAYVRDGRQQTTVVQPRDLGDRWGPRFEARMPEWNGAELRERLRGLGDEVRAWGLRGGRGSDGFLHEGRPHSDVRIFRDGPVRAFGGPGMAFTMGWGPGAGVGLVEMNPALGEYFGTERGVLVTEVDGESLLGLEAGDVVLSVDGREVSTPERLQRILASYAEDEELELRVLRHGSEITVTAPMR